VRSSLNCLFTNSNNKFDRYENRLVDEKFDWLNETKKVPLLLSIIIIIAENNNFDTGKGPKKTEFRLKENDSVILKTPPLYGMQCN